ncbi:DUF3732 domain-containing protein [Jiangella alba]|uniref:AAA domain-containing protein n=1 Tax=Jiangella alba TaxID=561176 RepID=A0A1H5J7Y2_9ACTN|nr:DUF3732 domain-containing protein [Jiangella alba]SEE48161.1 AAA domain-containing protein [Jiangella alba]
MTIKIQALHLYNRDGERRTLNFSPDSVNIITGRSGTGKSAVVDIIDYCLGSKRYNVAAGAVRLTVRHYALELTTRSGTILVARAAPAAGGKSTTQMHVSYREAGAVPPPVSELEPNADLNSAVGFLSRVTGIDENRTEVVGGTRAEFDATIRHALFFCIQEQREIANREILFHTQGEDFRPQTIRDVLPYFLGTVDPQYIGKRNLLRARERELRELERRSQDEHALARAPGRAAALLAEAIAVGLVSAPQDLSRAAVIETLAQVARSQAPEPQPVDRSDDLARLLDSREQLRGEYADTRAELRRLRRLVRYEDDFNGEAGERHGRLQALNLLRLPNVAFGTSACPVCASALADPITSVSEIQDHLEGVAREIADVSQDLPRLHQAVAASEIRLAELTESLAENQQGIDRIAESIELFESLRETSLQRAAIRGRTSLFLESVSRETEDAFVGDRIIELQREIDALKEDLDVDAAAERLAAALSRVSYRITDVANKLDLEHAPAPVRLDIRALTVVVDTAHGSYRLREIGSGENWLGYHLATLIGLHNHFSENDRPVPRFMVLDQPSQVYFPPDAADGDTLDDADHASLAQAFDELFRLTDEANGGFQVIVLEHADLDDARFQEAVVERWRADGQALIPQPWIDDLDSGDAG